MTLDAIKRLDVGSAFALAFHDERIPTLAEAFEFLKPTSLLLFLELKDPWRFPGIEAETARLIRAYDLAERTQVRSFYHDALHALYAAAPEIALSELWLDRIPNDDEVIFNTLDIPYRLLTAENIAHLQARGQRVTAWTVNDLADAQRLIAAGIDGLTTDYPDRLLPLLA
jgi:glycerophosphoryl diester phosphodiesterase